MVVVVVILEQYLPSVSLFLTHITLFFYVFFLYRGSLFLFSLRLLKSFFSCHRYKYNIYCFFFTHAFVYSFIYIFSLPIVPPHSIPKYDFGFAGLVAWANAFSDSTNRASIVSTKMVFIKCELQKIEWEVVEYERIDKWCSFSLCFRVTTVTSRSSFFCVEPTGQR